MVAMEKATHITLFGMAPDSIVDGPGLRFGVFVQGCTHACPGCHNPESQPSDGGTQYEISYVMDKIRENGLVKDVTISGGEPFEQAAACAELARQLKAEGYGVWVYSGYLFEDLNAREDEAVQALLSNCDVLIDGPFVESLKSYALTWKGSSNQRVIDLNATRKTGDLTLWSNSFEVPKKPASW